MHENGQSWEQTQESVESENIRCIRCGFENPPDKLFCEKCGTPLTKNDTEERPFNDMDTQNNAQQTGPDGQPYGPFGRQVVFDKDSDLEGIKLDDYAKFVKTNPLIFLSNFIRFGKFGGKISINFAAFLFPHLYFLFRKMNIYLSAGTMGFSLDIGIDVTGRVFQGISAATWYVSMALQFVAGFFGNYMYYKFAQKKIREIRSEDGTEQEIAEKIVAKGGTSWGLLFLALPFILR